MNSNKEITMMSYDAIAKQYYNEYNNDQSDLEYFDNFLKGSGIKVLDLGCGMGHYSRYMQNKGFNVTGVDFSSGMLNIAIENNPNIRFINSDVCSLPASLETDFDGVVLAFVLQHLSKEEARSCLLEARRHLKDSGKILVIFRSGTQELNEEEPFDTSFNYAIKEYTDEEIIELMSECGFETDRIEEKPYIYDPNSVCPTTKVLFGRSKDLIINNRRK